MTQKPNTATSDNSPDSEDKPYWKLLADVLFLKEEELFSVDAFVKTDPTSTSEWETVLTDRRHVLLEEYAKLHPPIKGLKAKAELEEHAKQILIDDDLAPRNDAESFVRKLDWFTVFCSPENMLPVGPFGKAFARERCMRQALEAAKELDAAGAEAACKRAGVTLASDEGEVEADALSVPSGDVVVFNGRT